MKVTLLHAKPLSILVAAVRRCYSSEGKSDSKWLLHDDTAYSYVLGDKDKALIIRCIESGHQSVLRHIDYSYDLSGFTRAVLQEQSTHKHTAHSTKSTRWTLKELKSEPSFFQDLDKEISNYTLCGKYLKYIVNENIYLPTVHALEAVRKNVVAGIPNDQAKYGIPENFLTSQIWTCNAQSLRNYLKVRTAKDAHFEIRQLATEIYRNLPSDHKFLFKDIVTPYEN